MPIWSISIASPRGRGRIFGDQRSRGAWHGVHKTSRVASKSGIPNLLSHTAVPTRQIRSRTFPGFRPIYRGGSNANDTKPHKSVHLYRPGTLLEQGASCFISDAKIEGVAIKFPHSFARARSSANFQQRESKATYPHLHFFLIR